MTNEKTNSETNNTTPFILKSTQAGIKEELQATGVNDTGTMKNREEGGEMWAEGQGTTTYTGATVNAPAEKGCKVFDDLGGSEMGAEGVIKRKP